jgi:4-amino-4-deoxy-L-arabinose transferase-like glycosyltransferase
MASDARTTHLSVPTPAWLRVTLLALTLLAFARQLYQLDLVNLWWDESLSLQRAESPWPDLLLGRLVISDGDNDIVTRDQHPFAYFVLLRAFVATTGITEFALRLPAAMASTLLVPTLWSLARLFERRDVVPFGAALAAALLAALSPFHLWFGHEVRMYAQVAVLAPLSLYWLLRWTEIQGRARRRAAFWAMLLTAALLLTHYFAIYLMPVYGAVVALHVFRVNRTRGLLLGGALGLAALAAGLTVAWWILSQPGAGANFAAVELDTLTRDLLNAFSFGPGVPVDQVWWLNLVFGATAVMGMAVAVRNRAALRADGWVVPALVVAPPLALWLVNRFLPSYMTSRHMAMISGAFLLAVAVGIGWLASRQRWAGVLLGALLAGCMLYANVHYYTTPDPRTTDFAGMGATLREHLHPGDAVVLRPPEFARMFAYYLPQKLVDAQPDVDDLVWQVMPLLTGDPADTEARLADLHGTARRIWLAQIPPLITDDFDQLTDEWLAANSFLVKEYGFESLNSFAKLSLFLPEPTVFDAGEIAAAPIPVDAEFGELIRLRGYDVGPPLVGGRSAPLNLYWEPLKPVDARYKYVLRLAQPESDPADDDGWRVLAQTEREPYEGAIATAFWQDPGKTILEYSELILDEPPEFAALPAGLHLLVQLYDMETGEKLPLTTGGTGRIAEDGVTLVLPFDGELIGAAQ